jgi:hypothetical protein
MKIIYKLSVLFFVSTIAYGLISHNFLDNKSKSKLLYDPNPKFIDKEELADKYLERIFKDDGDSAQKKEDIELGIDYLLSKLKKQEEKMLAQKEAKENVQDVALLTPKNNDFKSSEDKKKVSEPIKVEKQAVVIKNDQKTIIKKSENSSTDNKKLVTINSDKNKVYEFSKNEKVNQTKAKSQPQPESEQKSKNFTSNLIADKLNKTSTDKSGNYNRFYDNYAKIDVVAHEKAKFKDMVQKIEASRSERNKKLNEEF